MFNFKKNFYVLISVIMVFGLVLSGCGSKSSSTDEGNSGQSNGNDQEKIVIRWGHFAPAVQPMEAAAQNMAERVKERTNGQVEIQTFPASQLGSIKEQLEQLQAGSLQMMFSNPSYLSNIKKEFSIFDAPMVFENVDHVREFAHSDYIQGLAKELLTETDIRILDPTPIFGPRHLSVKQRPIKTPADLEGLSIRVHEAETRKDLIAAWGANPVVTPTAEMYTAMQTGLADGQESPLSWQADNKYWEVQKYVSLTGHFVQAEFIIINDEFLQSLPEDIQKILKEEAIKAADEMTKLYEEANNKAIDTLKENGMVIVEGVDKEAFREATQPMWEKWQSQWGEGLHNKVINREYESLTPEEWQNY